MKMRPVLKSARFEKAGFSIKDLSSLYRVLDNIEETTNMAHQYVRHIEKRDTPTIAYLTQLQEWLSVERIEVVDAIRRRAPANSAEETSRLCVIILYEAWCEEFQKETLEQLASSSLTAGAV